MIEFLASRVRRAIPKELKMGVTRRIVDYTLSVSNTFSAFSIEQIDFSGAVGGLRGEMRRLNVEVGAISQDTYQHRFPSKSNRERFQSLVQKRNSVVDFLVDIDTQSESRMRTEGGVRNWMKTLSLIDDASDEERTKILSQLDFRFAAKLLHTAIELTLRGISSEQKATLGKDDKGLSERLDLWNFTESGAVLVKIAGVPLIDVFKANGGKVHPDNFYRFVVECQLLTLGKNPQDCIKENVATLGGKYPSIVGSFIAMASTQANAFYFSEPDVIDRYSTSSKVGTEAKNRAKQLSTDFKEGIESIREILLYPDSPKFQQLKSVIMEYIAKGGLERIVALNVAINGSADFVKRLYRVAQSQITSGQEKEFYSSIIEPLREFIEDSVSTQHLLTSEDVDSFFDKVNGETAPLISDLERYSITLSNLTRERNFSVDPLSVNLNGIVVPDAITLNLDPYNPRRISLRFVYVSEDNVSDSLDFIVDAKKIKGGIDWSFVDNPSSMPSVRNALLRAVGEILAKIEREIREKKKVETTKPSSPVTSTDRPKEKIRPITYEPPQSTKRRAMIIEKGSPKVIDQLAIDPGIKRNIVVVDQSRFVRELADLHAVDQQNVKEAISEFNARGVGRFKRLHGEWLLDSDLYSLRVKSTVRAGVRIILKEIPSQGRERKFQVVSVGYRKDAYRKTTGSNSPRVH